MKRQGFVDVFFGWRGTVVSEFRCPYTVDLGTLNRSAICRTVFSRASYSF